MLLVTLFVSILISSCADVKIHDDPWCADAGRHGAECFYTLSDREFSLDKFQWDAKRVGQICSATENPGEGYKNLRVALEKLCADSNKCSPEQIQAVQNIQRQLENVEEKISHLSQ